jgi:hypothetical protein
MTAIWCPLRLFVCVSKTFEKYQTVQKWYPRQMNNSWVQSSFSYCQVEHWILCQTQLKGCSAFSLFTNLITSYYFLFCDIRDKLKALSFSSRLHLMVHQTEQCNRSLWMAAFDLGRARCPNQRKLHFITDVQKSLKWHCSFAVLQCTWDILDDHLIWNSSIEIVSDLT